jgi:hypothetical protein
MPIKKFRLGKKLNNGSILIAICGDKDWETSDGYRTVLAINNIKGPAEYVTWSMDAEGNTQAGRYFQSFPSAVRDFKERTKNQVQIATNPL